MKFLSIVFLLMLLHINTKAQANITLTAAYENEKNLIKLRWQHNDERITLYILQRSSDNYSFTDIVSKKATDIAGGELFKYTDKNVSAGKNYYRLKIYRSSNTYETTSPVMVIIGNPGNNWLIYPVPVGTVLNLQYNGNQLIQGVISVIIQSVSSGTVFTRLRLASTTRFIQIPVSNIGRGLYDIRIYIQEKVVWNQRFAK
jgi:hypothetical protein